LSNERADRSSLAEEVLAAVRARLHDVLNPDLDTSEIRVSARNVSEQQTFDELVKRIADRVRRSVDQAPNP
jgi:hypothetical protein